MKYIVMECHPGYAVVLDEHGRFLKAANRNYEIGQTVTEIIAMRPPASQSIRKKITRWTYTAMAAAACLMIMITSLVYLVPYGSVYMSINPEVRIDVNRQDRVVGLSGVNDDGGDLIEGYRFRQKELDLVMDELVDRAIGMGYLHEGGKITLTLDGDSWSEEYSNALSENLSRYLEEKLSVTIEITGSEDRDHQVVIPVTPDETKTEPEIETKTETQYRDTDYGTIPETTPPPETEKQTELRPDAPVYHTSDYISNLTDDDLTDYEIAVPDNDNISDYEITVPENDNVSDYEITVPDHTGSDYGSPYSDNRSEYEDDSNYGDDDD